MLDATCWERYELVNKDYVDTAILNAISGGNANKVATKDDLVGVLRATSQTFDVPTGNDPIEFTFEVVGENIAIQVVATASYQSPNFVNYVQNPISSNGLENNGQGVALQGSVVPTANDFVTYGS